MTQSRFTQVPAHHLFQLGQRQAGKVRRQFLGPDLQQKGRHEVLASTAAHCIEGVWIKRSSPALRNGKPERLRCPVLDAVSLRS